MKSSLVLGLVLFASAPTFAALGGNSGGGGDVRIAQPLSADELKQFIREDVPRLVRWFYSAASTPTKAKTPDQDNYWFHTPIYNKLYEGTETIFTRIDAAKLKLDGPCEDPNTKAKKDASANAADGTLCFDVEALIKNTDSRVQRSHVLGLAAHEYAHLIDGVTEAEARFVGVFAEGFSTVDGTILRRFEGDWADLAKNADSPASLAGLVDRAATAPLLPLAFSVMNAALSAHQEIQRADALARLAGLHPWTPMQQARAMAAQFKAMNLMTLMCAVPDAMLAPKQIIEDCANYQMFKPTGPATRTFADLLDQEGVTLSYPVDIILRNLTTGDRAALADELRELAKLTAELFPDAKTQ